MSALVEQIQPIPYPVVSEELEETAEYLEAKKRLEDAQAADPQFK
jgi:hypothetical protein